MLVRLVGFYELDDFLFMILNPIPSCFENPTVALKVFFTYFDLYFVKVDCYERTIAYCNVDLISIFNI